MPSTATLISGFLLASVVAVALVLWVSQSDAGDDGLLIAVFPPTMNERTIMQSIVAADGAFVRTSLPSTIVVAHSQTPGFAARLKATGAWLTYAQAPFGPELGGCLVLATAPYEPAVMRQ